LITNEEWKTLAEKDAIDNMHIKGLLGISETAKEKNEKTSKKQDEQEEQESVEIDSSSKLLAPPSSKLLGSPGRGMKAMVSDFY
jgi:hypothetical protein